MSSPANMVSVTKSDDGVEFRVLLRGLKLDDNTRTLLDATIHSAVLQEIAFLDLPVTPQVTSPAEDPQTRSIFEGLASTIRGLVLRQN